MVIRSCVHGVKIEVCLSLPWEHARRCPDLLLPITATKFVESETTPLVIVENREEFVHVSVHKLSQVLCGDRIQRGMRHAMIRTTPTRSDQRNSQSENPFRFWLKKGHRNFGTNWWLDLKMFWCKLQKQYSSWILPFHFCFATLIFFVVTRRHVLPVAN